MTLTWIETPIGPTEMWVEARTARDYESQGFEIVDYEPPPRWLMGCYSGRALIRKPGSECIHIWSPELAALHKHACDALDRHQCWDLGFRSTVRKAIRAAHSKLFNELRYHEDLICVERFDTQTPLSVPQGCIVAALRSLAAENKVKAREALEATADDVESFKYNS